MSESPLWGLSYEKQACVSKRGIGLFLVNTVSTLIRGSNVTGKGGLDRVGFAARAGRRPHLGRKSRSKP